MQMNDSDPDLLLYGGVDPAPGDGVSERPGGGAGVPLLGHGVEPEVEQRDVHPLTLVHLKHAVSRQCQAGFLPCIERTLSTEMFCSWGIPFGLKQF